MISQEELKLVFGLVRIKSISTQEEYLGEMVRARDYLKKIFEDLGTCLPAGRFEVEYLKGEKHDLVLATRIEDPKLPTVLIYGHYDVQPPEPIDEWQSPPFEPEIREGMIYGRGTTDNKCQLMTHVLAVKRMIEKDGRLPVNIKFLIEGEEEVGSVSIEKIVAEHGDKMRGDYLIVSDLDMADDGRPAITVGLKGIVYVEVYLKTAKHDLHSGVYGGVAENPAIVMAGVLTKLKDEEGKVLIPGFYDGVVGLSDEEKADYQKMEPTEEALREEGVTVLGGGEKNFGINERRWARPTLDVNGWLSGYIGEGAKTIIPAETRVKLSMRLVPNQEPEKIAKLTEDYIRTLVPEGSILEVKVLAKCWPYKADTSLPIFGVAKEVMERAFGKKTVYIGCGGSIGFVPVVAKKLGVPVLLLGLGLPGDNMHAPNERFKLENMDKGIEAFGELYGKIK